MIGRTSFFEAITVFSTPQLNVAYSFPKLATIARACSCSVKTVCNALAWLAAWGFLSWKRRLKRVPTQDAQAGESKTTSPGTRYSAGTTRRLLTLLLEIKVLPSRVRL